MYQHNVEFDSCPPLHEVRHLPGGMAEIVFWQNVRHIQEDERERWIADCTSMTTSDRHGILEIVDAEPEAWLDAAISQSDMEAELAREAELLTPGQIRELKEQNEMYADLIQELAMIVYA